MSGTTNIAWTDATWNPVTGCTKVSPGCLHCYAETLDKRFHWDGSYVPWTVAAQRKAGVSAIHLHPERLDAPLHWKKPRRIFVNSMSDLFHEDVPDEFICQVFQTMVQCPQHTFQVLTKRPARMESWMKAWRWRELPCCSKGRLRNPLPNVWLGVSVENQRYADERLPLLAQCPAAVRFVSVEPLLGPVDLAQWFYPPLSEVRCGGLWHEGTGVFDAQPQYGSPIAWVICGGESGPGHRPMDTAWVQSIADQCTAVSVPLFVKQDSGPRPGQQGVLPNSLWARKEMP